MFIVLSASDTAWSVLLAEMMRPCFFIFGMTSMCVHWAGLLQHTLVMC